MIETSKAHSFHACAPRSRADIELVCPANSLVTLRTAIDNGANCVRLVGRNERHSGSPGAYFDHASMAKGIRYAHDRECTVVLDLDAYVRDAAWKDQRALVDNAARSGIDAIRVSAPAFLLYASANYPGLSLHYPAPDFPLSAKTLNFYKECLGVSRVILPRVVSLIQLEQFSSTTTVNLEVVGFGRLSSIVEGRGKTSSDLKKTTGDCAGDVHMDDREPDSNATCVSRCGGTEIASNDSFFAEDDRPDTNGLRLLPRITTAGVHAIQIDTLDLAPCHLAQLIRVWREAIDDCLDDLDHYSVKPAWVSEINKISKPSLPY